MVPVMDTLICMVPHNDYYSLQTFNVQENIIFTSFSTFFLSLIGINLFTVGHNIYTNDYFKSPNYDL